MKIEGLPRWAVAVVLAAACTTVVPRALDVSLGVADIERAQRLARGSESERARFHAAYIFTVGDPTVPQIEVITEFRRAVMAVEDHLRQGDWMFSQSVKSVEEATKSARGLVSIVAQIRFSPLNVYTSVPPFTIGLGPAGGPLAPLETETTPQYASSDSGSTLIGAVIRADVSAAGLGQGTRAVGVLLKDKQQARIAVDFSKFD